MYASYAPYDSYVSLSGKQATSPGSVSQVNGQMALVKGPSAPSIRDTKRPALGELLSRLRAECNDLTEDEWKQRMVQLGLTEKEADSLFLRLAENELFWHDRDGKTYWKWA